MLNQTDDDSAFGGILTQGLPVGIVAVDLEYRITRWNYWMEKHSNIREQGIIGQNLFEKYPDIRERGRDRFLTECIEKTRPFLLSPIIHQHFIPLEIVKNDEVILMIQNVRIYPLIKNGTSEGAVIVISDLTEQILHEKEIQRLNRILRGIRNIDRLIARISSESELLNGITGILTEDIGYRLACIGLVEKTAIVKPVAVAVAGYDAPETESIRNDLEEILNIFKTGDAPLTNRIQEDSVSEIRQLAEKTGSSSFCLLPIRIDGNFIGMLNIYSEKQYVFQGEELELLDDVTSDISFAIKTLRGRTARRQAEADLRASRKNLLFMIGELTIARKAAESGTLAKKQFIVNVNHEVRTQVHIIVGMINMVLMSSLDSEQRDLLNNARISADSLMKMFINIMDIAEAASDRMKLEEIDFDLRAIWESAINDMMPDIRRKGLDLISHTGSDFPLCIYGDPDRLRRIIVTLIGNAVKFTERGKVILSVEKESENEKEVILHFSVADTGIGIAPSDIQRIFEKFTQADGTSTRRYSGIGTGLTLSRQLIEMMGGRLWAESLPGKGSTFHFTVKVKPGKSVERKK